MSFSSEQKKELISSPIKNSCCKKAYIEGILASSAQICNGNIHISVYSSDIADHIKKIVADIYNKSAETLSSQVGGRRVVISFTSTSALKYISDIVDNDIAFDEKCPTCLSYFLKGVFLATGRVSDPQKQYCLEFAVKNNIEKFVEFFDQLGIKAGISVKKCEKTIFIKNSSVIEDFFVLSSMNNAVFAVINAKIQGDIRNNVNRVLNCETKNIDRAVSASMTQITLIEKMLKRGLLSQLPPELEQTARLRLEYRDYSLSQLAAVFTPAITKSGLSHRLKKITSIAETFFKD